MVQNTVIKPMQNKLLAKFVNVFVEHSVGINNMMYLEIKNSTPVSFFGTIDLGTTLTKDEMRSEVGFAPLPNTQEGASAVQQIRDTVNSFSPLVVNKMLDKLESDEIRQLLGYDVASTETLPETPNDQMQ